MLLCMCYYVFIIIYINSLSIYVYIYECVFVHHCRWSWFGSIVWLSFPQRDFLCGWGHSQLNSPRSHQHSRLLPNSRRRRLPRVRMSLSPSSSRSNSSNCNSSCNSCSNCNNCSSSICNSICNNRWGQRRKVAAAKVAKAAKRPRHKQSRSQRLNQCLRVNPRRRRSLSQKPKRMVKIKRSKVCRAHPAPKLQPVPDMLQPNRPPPASSQTVVERRPSQSLKEDAKTKKKEKDVAKDAAKETEHSPQAKAPALKRQEEEEERKREERREREEDRRREEEAKKEKKERLSAEETGKKKESKAKAAQPSAAPSVEKSAGFSKQPPTHPPVQPSPQPVQSEKKLPPQPQPPAPPLQPPTLPPAQPPVPTQAHPAHPAVPLNSMWADHKPSVNLDFAGPSSQTAMQEDSTAMALPPPPSIPPPPAPCGNMAGVKPKAISPAPASEMDPSMRNIQRPPPGIDLGLLLTGPAPGLSPQPVLPPPGIAKPFPNDSTSLAPAEAAAVSAVQGLGTDSFFGGAPGLDFGGLNGLGAIGFPPGISPKQPHGHRLLQRPGSIPGMPGNSMPEEFYPQTMPDTSNRLGMFQEAAPASSSLFSSPFGMFGPIGSHSLGLRLLRLALDLQWPTETPTNRHSRLQSWVIEQDKSTLT